MKKNYYYLIDLLRWFAAMGVLLHHYAAHFKIHEINNSNFFNYLIKNSIIGSYGVWLFWSISGFVFTRVYLGSKDNLKQFSIKRFARLYPLHFVTLIMIMILQYYSFKKFSHFQIYHENNISTFIQNIFFMNNQNSFNAVIWSVSVEIPVYFILFFYLKFNKNHILIKTLILVTIFWLNLKIDFLYYSLSACLFYFFFGVLIYLFCNLMNKLSFFLLIISIAGIFITPYIFEIKNSLLLIKYHNYIPTTLLFFCSLLILCFSLEKYLPKLGKKIKFLGDSSYAVYLIHVPIQVLILILNDLNIIHLELFAYYESLIIFFIAVNVIAYLAFKLFEVPMKKKITIFLYQKLALNINKLG
jgi:peptidoglycan/LPS O-acetylase OafA/YrhL